MEGPIKIVATATLPIIGFYWISRAIAKLSWLKLHKIIVRTPILYFNKCGGISGRSRELTSSVGWASILVSTAKPM